MTNCHFTRNVLIGNAAASMTSVTPAKGGALYLSYVNATLNLCTFDGNNLTTNPSTNTNLKAQGGAVFTTYVPMTIKSSLFRGNSLSCAGTAIGGTLYYSSGLWLAISNSTFLQNTATSNGTYASSVTGGGVYFSTTSGTLSISNSTFKRNLATLSQTAYSGVASTREYPGLRVCRCRVLLSVHRRSRVSHVGGGMGETPRILASPIVIESLVFGRSAPLATHRCPFRRHSDLKIPTMQSASTEP